MANGVLIRGMHIGTLHERLPARRVRDTEREGSKREEYTGGSLTSFITLINATLSTPISRQSTPLCLLHRRGGSFLRRHWSLIHDSRCLIYSLICLYIALYVYMGRNNRYYYHIGPTCSYVLTGGFCIILWIRCCASTGTACRQFKRWLTPF